MVDSESSLPTIRVVAAVLHDDQGRVLIAERPAGKPLAGYWEFPGGKLEPGESAHNALLRELHEELGIEVVDARPLMQLNHSYPERHVELDVWRVLHYEGKITARECQGLDWVNPGALPECNLLPADVPITNALRLPPRMLVTPSPAEDENVFYVHLKRVLAGGVQLVQFRAPDLPPETYARMARTVIRECHARGARVVLNADPDTAMQLRADGVHLTSRRLLELKRRELPAAFLIGASCHDAAQLSHVESCGLDYAVLGPVLETATHPDARPLGWNGFARLIADCRLPVFAIGGLQPGDLPRVRDQGGYGVAAIRGFWDAV